MLYIAWKRGFPRKFGFVLFRLIKKRSFNLLCVLDLFFRTPTVNSVSDFFPHVPVRYCVSLVRPVCTDWHFACSALTALTDLPYLIELDWVCSSDSSSSDLRRILHVHLTYESAYLFGGDSEQSTRRENPIAYWLCRRKLLCAPDACWLCDLYRRTVSFGLTAWPQSVTSSYVIWCGRTMRDQPSFFRPLLKPFLSLLFPRHEKNPRPRTMPL